MKTAHTPKELESAQFRAAASDCQAFGTTPQQALSRLMRRLHAPATGPIVIWPYNRGDSFFGEAQQARLNELKSRADRLTDAERQELERLVEEAFDATVSRTQSLSVTKS